MRPKYATIYVILAKRKNYVTSYNHGGKWPRSNQRTINISQIQTNNECAQRNQDKNNNSESYSQDA
ncbi:MAG: hypothetical protein IJS88_01960 [Alphaproteobacteria bacterium]|nr:hypothetical protein [Alphaproteobacteria bacterium]